MQIQSSSQALEGPRFGESVPGRGKHIAGRRRGALTQVSPDLNRVHCFERLGGRRRDPLEEGKGPVRGLEQVGGRHSQGEPVSGRQGLGRALHANIPHILTEREKRIGVGERLVELSRGVQGRISQLVVPAGSSRAVQGGQKRSGRIERILDLSVFLKSLVRSSPSEKGPAPPLRIVDGLEEGVGFVQQIQRPTGSMILRLGLSTGPSSPQRHLGPDAGTQIVDGREGREVGTPCIRPPPVHNLDSGPERTQAHLARLLGRGRVVGQQRVDHLHHVLGSPLGEEVGGHRYGLRVLHTEFGIGSGECGVRGEEIIPYSTFLIPRSLT